MRIQVYRRKHDNLLGSGKKICWSKSVWEILVQKLLKLVELFKSYGLFGEPKVVDFLFFGKMLKK
jgi:hypothetical protein